jgi:hypothetical protein
VDFTATTMDGDRITAAYCSWTELRYFASARHGGHPAYQKLMTTTSPRRDAAVMRSPSIVVAVKSTGACRSFVATSVTAPVPEM